MPDIYESRLIELTAEISYEIKDPYGTVLSEAMRKKFDTIKLLADDCKMANEIRNRDYEYTDELNAWIKEDLLKEFKERIDRAVKRSETSRQGVFFNIVYCILERWQVKFKCKSRLRLISKDKFCELVGKDRKTLNRRQTIYYTTERISQEWLYSEIKDNHSIQKLLSDISHAIRDKIIGAN